MKEKMISMFLWIMIWVVGTSSYHFFVKENPNPTPQTNSERWVWTEVNQEMLERFSQTTWISKEELQKELDMWKDVRTLMQERWIEWWMWWGMRVWVWRE